MGDAEAFPLRLFIFHIAFRVHHFHGAAFVAFSRVRINSQAHVKRSTPISPTRASKPRKM
jgi:hypothetical protein